MAKKKKEIENIEKLINIDYEDELKSSMLDYSFESINRAIPDIRDGLKPVHRRILYSMYLDGNTNDKPYKKSVKAVGSTLSRFHPHGDCLKGNTKIYLLDGTIKTIEELYKIYIETKEDIWGLGIDKLGKIIPVKITDFRIGQYTNKIYNIKFKNGFVISTTNQHQFKDINGFWIKAENLAQGNVIDYACIDNEVNKTIYGLRTKKSDLDRVVCNFFDMGENYNFSFYKDKIYHVNRLNEDNTPYNLKIKNKLDDEFQIEFEEQIKEAKYNDSFERKKNIDKIYKSKCEYYDLLNLNIDINNDLTFKQKLSLNRLKNKKFLKNDIDNLPIVDSVLIEDVENVPMYDFTVDTFENILIVADKNNKTLACVHNSSVYDALVRMSQDFKMNLQLIDLHGNGGSIDGDPSAAMRYTEARLSKASSYLLQDLEKGVVPFVDNFDGEEQEPTILPAKYPNLLVNGTSGLSVGMASDIPSHNLSEVIDGYLAYLNNKNISIKELMEYIKGPDYCTGGLIINKSNLLNLYETGKGNVMVRAKTHFEKGDNGRTNIIIDEIPFGISGNKLGLVSKMIDLVINKVLTEVHSVEDESSKDGIRIVVQVKKGYDAENVLKKLFAKTQLQYSENYNFLVTLNGAPKIVNLKEYFQHYFDFNKECIIKKYEYLLRKIKDRKEIVDGLINAIDVLDIIIEVARYHDTKNDMLLCLTKGITDNIKFKTKSYSKIAKTFKFTEKQATAIRALRLDQLSNLEVKKLIDEQTDLNKKEIQYNKIIKSEKGLIKEIQKDLLEIKKSYITKRKTELTDLVIEKFVETKQVENVIVVIDKFNYIKSIADTSANKENEKINTFKYIIDSNSEDKIGIFTNEGNLYQIKLEDIPIGKLNDKGATVESLCELTGNEYILNVFSMQSLKNHKLLFHTELGFVKIVDTNEFVSIKKTIKSTKLENNDKLLFVNKIENYTELLCKTEKRYQLKYLISDISELKKNSKGVKSIDMLSTDKVEEVLLINDEVYLKNKKLKKIPLKKRGRKGIIIK